MSPSRLVKSVPYVERVCESEDGRWVQLSIFEARPWDGSDERRLELETRINNHLAYILNGQLRRDFPRCGNKSVRIELVASSSPDPRTQWLLDRVSGFCRALGVDFRLTISPVGTS